MPTLALNAVGSVGLDLCQTSKSTILSSRDVNQRPVFQSAIVKSMTGFNC